MKKALYILIILFAAIGAVNAQNNPFERKQVNLDKASQLMKRGKYDQAAAIYSQLNTEFPNDSFITVSQARELWAAGATQEDTLMYSQALSLFQKLASSYPAARIFQLYVAHTRLRIANFTALSRTATTAQKKALIPVYESSITMIETSAAGMPEARFFVEEATAAKTTLKNIQNEL